MSYLRSLSLTQSCKVFLMYPFKSFKILALTFRSMIYFEVIFVYEVKDDAHFFCIYSIVPATFTERTIISSLNYHGAINKNQLTIHILVSFWALFCATDL